MTIKVKANGLTFSFPDGTTQAEIEDVIDEHFSEPGFWSEVGAVAATSAAKLVDGIAQMLPGMNSAQYDFDIDKGVTKVRSTEIAENLPDTLKPQTTAGQIASEIIPAIPGAFAGGRNLNPRALDATTGWLKRAAYAIPENIGASAGAQLLSKGDATAGGTASDVAIGAALNASLPGLGRFVKALMRGQNEGGVLEATQTINEQIAGTFTPSRAVLDGSRLSAHVENISGNGLFSAGHMQRFNEANNAALNEFADVLRRGMAEGDRLTSAEMGDELRAAANAFIQAPKEAGAASFQAAARYAAGIRIRLLDTAKEMAAIRKVGEENTGIAKLIDTADMRALAQGIDDSAGGLTLEGVIRLKGKISDLMDNPGLGMATTDTQQLTRLYNALNDDVTRVLGANDPAALRLWKQGNELWAEYAENTKDINKLFGADQGDALYARLFGKPSDSLAIINADKVRMLLGMLPDDVAKRVRAEIVYRAGLEAAGQAGNEGRKFSAAAFLTNWTKLKENGVADLLAGSHRADIEALALISDRLKSLGRAANFSNSANHLNLVNTAQGLGAAVIGLNPFAAIPLALPAITARFMTNPEAAASLRRLADGAINDGEARKTLVRLVIAASQGDDTEVDVDVILDAIEGAESQPAK